MSFFQTKDEAVNKIRKKLLDKTAAVELADRSDGTVLVAIEAAGTCDWTSLDNCKEALLSLSSCFLTAGSSWTK